MKGKCLWIIFYRAFSVFAYKSSGWASVIGGGLMPHLTLAIMHVEGDLRVQLGGDRDLGVPLGGGCILLTHSEGGVPLALDNVSGNRSRTLRKYAWESPVSDTYESCWQFRDVDEPAYESQEIYRDRVPYGHDFGVRQEGRHYPLESFSRGSDSHESLYSSNREWEDMDHYLRERELRLVTREEKLSTQEEDVAQRQSQVLSREMEICRQHAEEDRHAQDLERQERELSRREAEVARLQRELEQQRQWEISRGQSEAADCVSTGSRSRSQQRPAPRLAGHELQGHWHPPVVRQPINPSAVGRRAPADECPADPRPVVQGSRTATADIRQFQTVISHLPTAVSSAVVARPSTVISRTPVTQLTTVSQPPPMSQPTVSQSTTVSQ